MKILLGIFGIVVALIFSALVMGAVVAMEHYFGVLPWEIEKIEGEKDER